MKKPAPLWTQAMDERLMDLIAEGKPFTVIAGIIGRTAASCAARFRRLAENMGAQAI